MALSVAFTTIYQWAWVLLYLLPDQLGLAALFFVLFAVVNSCPLWLGSENVAFRRIGETAAVLPLLLALYLASIPDLGSHVTALFGYFLVLAAVLAALALFSRPGWLPV